MTSTSRWRVWLAEVATTALDLVIAQQCAGCARPGTAWCASCSAQCAGPGLAVPGPVPWRAAAAHTGPAGRAVVAFKDGGSRRLGGPLGDLLASSVRAVLADAALPPGSPVWLVPVPARRGAARARGADHMAVLSGRAARALRAQGIPANRCRALTLVRDSRDQVGLDRRGRRDNVAGTMRGLAVPDGVIVVVDDVTTTGATVGEAVRALRAAGGHRPLAATVTWAVPGVRHLAFRARAD